LESDHELTILLAERSKRGSGERMSQTKPDRDAETDFPDLVGRGMAQWRRERTDIDCGGKAVVGRLLLLQDTILKTVNAALAPHGLRYPAYAVLATLRVSGRPYRMSPSQLQATMLFTSGGISNLIARVEKQGYVRRTIDPADKRGVRVELTRKGIDIANRAMVDHAAAERQLCAMLSPAEQGTLAALLSQMIVLNGPRT
jgi:DNA-binding MarR family transcriptional regulator